MILSSNNIIFLAWIKSEPANSDKLNLRILLTGPTAVGKTRVSLELAGRLDGEIISSDSRQCYKYMNIGTATPTKEERGGIPHYNVSIIDPARKDSAANFYRRAKEWERQISEQNHTILYVGGSTLHQRCIIQPFDDIPDANEQNIAELEQHIVDNGIESLFEQLQNVDPKYAAKMDGMNTQRIIRALDVWMQSGRPFSSFHSDGPITLPGDLLVIALRRKRQALYDRINRRVDEMFDKGFLNEVQSILNKGYSPDDPGLNTVGYKEAIAHLNDALSYDAMIRDIKTQTRRYAKRQLTYFRRWDFVHWLDLDTHSTKDVINRILQLTSQNS